jgi:hypothetical protein
LNKNAFSVTLVAVLSACSGGGDSEPNPVADNRPAVVLSASNYEVAAKEVMSGSSNAANLAEFSGFLTGAEVRAGISFSQFVQMKYPLAVNAAKQAAYLSGVTVNESEACSEGGTVTYSGNVGDEYNPSRGDDITVTANNCREYGSTINGSMRLRIVNVTGNIDSYPFSVEIEASTDNFGASSGTVTYQSTGSLKMRVNATNYSSQNLNITIPSMVSTVSADGKTETFRYLNYGLDMIASGSMVSLSINGGLNVPSLDGNLLNMQTSQPFVFYSDYPSSGSAIVTTASGEKMRISSSSASTALIELDANSDGTYEASKSMLWSQVF